MQGCTTRKFDFWIYGDYASDGCHHRVGLSGYLVRRGRAGRIDRQRDIEGCLVKRNMFRPARRAQPVSVCVWCLGTLGVRGRPRSTPVCLFRRWVGQSPRHSCALRTLRFRWPVQAQARRHRRRPARARSHSSLRAIGPRTSFNSQRQQN